MKFNGKRGVIEERELKKQTHTHTHTIKQPYKEKNPKTNKPFVSTASTLSGSTGAADGSAVTGSPTTSSTLGTAAVLAFWYTVRNLAITFPISDLLPQYN
jgi:hypothetical protein